MNTISDFAKKVMLGGLELSEEIPATRATDKLAVQNIFRVPEKPKGYSPKFKTPEGEVAILVTGGLDSSALYYMAKKQGKKVRAFYIHIGQPYGAKEMLALNKMGIKFELIDTELKIDKDKFWKHIIPGRNLYFLTLVAEKINGGEVWFGATDGEMPIHGGDKSLEFIDYCNGLFNKLPYPVMLKVPLSEMTKTDIVAWWKDNAPWDNLSLTISCFEEGQGHCGQCQSCLRKALAFISNGFTLKTNTDIKIGAKQYIDKYNKVLREALRNNDFSHYSKRRCEQDLKAIAML